ncbi:MAG TPA: Fic family protein [Veillonellaceae bacterium]|nr:Fic family protein [Veillonellaceae bacterium]
MKFISLTKYFYQHTQEEYETEYIRRLEAPFTVHFNIPIHQYNRKSAYPAFLCYTGEILRLVEKFHKTYEQFLYTVNTVPPVVLYQFTRLSIVEEVKSTNDIEGVRSTKKEIREIIEKRGTHYHRLQSVVHQYLELLGEEEIKFDTCQDIRNFYDDFTHQEITRENPQNRLDGSLFRKEPVQIEAATGKTIHQGLYPESRIIEALDQALRILHSEEYPLLIRLALFHYFFVYIHPFYDGNGRTDRFITSYFLSRQFHRLLAVRLSIYIKRNKSRYYHMLEEADSERNRGDMTPFVIGFLEILIGSTEDTIGVLSRKNEQMRKYESRIDAFQLQDKLLKEIYITLLQAALFYGEGISMADLMKVTGKNRGTIQKRIDEIPGNHLIVTKAGKTNYYKLNLMLFKEN